MKKNNDSKSKVTEMFALPFEVKTFFENGNLRERGSYKNASQNGLWEYFREDGSLEKTIFWKDGVKIDD
jgi:antitoxin component YwqK of YwqJK toxin-antitoxin module